MLAVRKVDGYEDIDTASPAVGTAQTQNHGEPHGTADREEEKQEPGLRRGGAGHLGMMGA